MVKLSDYLSYLNNEIAQARRGMDLEAIQRAKEYAKHEYLKYFKAPRFTMPSIKLELPIKISEIDSKVTYRFEFNRDAFLEEVNHKITLIERDKKVKLKHLTAKDLEEKEFKNIITQLNQRDYNFVGPINLPLDKIEIKEPVVTPIFDHVITPHRPSGSFSPMELDVELKQEINEAIKEALKEQYKPKKAILNDIYIQPDTNSLKRSGDDKILVKLSVELVEENLQIVKLTDANGNEYEEIIID